MRSNPTCQHTPTRGYQGTVLIHGSLGTGVFSNSPALYLSLTSLRTLSGPPPPVFDMVLGTPSPYPSKEVSPVGSWGYLRLRNFIVLYPTRLLRGGFNEVPASFSLERPSFDDQGFYTGPLLPRAARKQLVGWASTGFATTGTEQWPSLICRWIAQAVLQNVSYRMASPSVLAGGGVMEPSDRRSYPINDPDGGKLCVALGRPGSAKGQGKRGSFMMELV